MPNALKTLCLSLMVMGIIACGGKYDDVIEINTEFITLVETYVAGLDTAGNAAEMAKVMNTFAAGLEKLVPQMNAISDKHPELKNEGQQPPELQASTQKVEAVGKQLAKSVFKTMPHMSDAAVMEAQQRIAVAWIQNP